MAASQDFQPFALPWRNAHDSVGTSLEDASADGTLHLQTSRQRIVVHILKARLTIDLEEFRVHQAGRVTMAHRTQNLLGAKVKSCGLLSGKLQTSIVLVVDQVEAHAAGALLAQEEVELYRLPSTPSHALPFSVQEQIVQRINSWLGQVRGIPVGLENDVCISASGLPVSSDVDQPLLQAARPREQYESSGRGEEALATSKTVCRRWQQTPSIPLAPSRFEISTHGSELTIVSTPNPHLMFAVVTCGLVALVALLCSLLTMHMVVAIPIIIVLCALVINGQASIRRLSLKQVLRVSPDGWSVYSCWPACTKLRVLSSGMQLDSFVPDINVNETVIGAKVVTAPRHVALLPLQRTTPPLDVVLRTTRATYTLSRLLGRRGVRGSALWLQQDAETLVAAINRHILAVHDGRPPVAIPDNDVRPSVFASLDRIGSRTECLRTQQQRLAAVATDLLEQQADALRLRNFEHAGRWRCSDMAPKIDRTCANAENLLLSEGSGKQAQLRTVVMLRPWGFSVVCLMFVVPPVLFIVLGWLEGAVLLFHSLGFLALLQGFVALRAVVVDVSAEGWSVRRVCRWTLRPKDRGMFCMRWWAGGNGGLQRLACLQQPTVLAKGSIKELRGCEVRVKPALWPFIGQSTSVVLHYHPERSSGPQHALVLLNSRISPATLVDQLLLAQEVNSCLEALEPSPPVPIAADQKPVAAGQPEHLL